MLRFMDGDGEVGQGSVDLDILSIMQDLVSSSLAVKTPDSMQERPDEKGK